MVSAHVDITRTSNLLTEKRKELNELKIDYDKKKQKASEETAALEFKDKQLSQMKANLKEEEDRFEVARKKNISLTEQLQSCYRQKLLLSESLDDESLKEKVLAGALAKLSTAS
jgi:hypothetical protein